jgi:hypothetical protein
MLLGLTVIMLLDVTGDDLRKGRFLWVSMSRGLPWTKTTAYGGAGPSCGGLTRIRTSYVPGKL